MKAKSIVPNLQILSIITILFLALLNDKMVLALELKDRPHLLAKSTAIASSFSNTFLEPNTVIIQRKGDKQKEDPDLTHASWWEKLLYKLRILQIKTEFVDDGMEKIIRGEKSLLILAIFLAIVLFWRNNARLMKKSPHSRSRRLK